MATSTTNYGLHKIDLTDAPPDITVLNPNFDKIDEQLGYNRIHSYTDLNQFGLSDVNMSTTDFGANIDTILTKLSDVAANISLIVQSDRNPNLHASLIAKLNADTDLTFNTDSHAGWIYIQFCGEEYRPTVITTNVETASYYDSIWTCVYNKGSNGNQISTFKSFFDLASMGITYGTEAPTSTTPGKIYIQIVE